MFFKSQNSLTVTNSSAVSSLCQTETTAITIIIDILIHYAKQIKLIICPTVTKYSGLHNVLMGKFLTFQKFRKD